MNRHYFISDDLDDLNHIEEQLARRGIFKPQIHIYGDRSPHLLDAGNSDATPRWIIMAQQNFKDITTTTFP